MGQPYFSKNDKSGKGGGGGIIVCSINDDMLTVLHFLLSFFCVAAYIQCVSLDSTVCVIFPKIYQGCKVKFLAIKKTESLA